MVGEYDRYNMQRMVTLTANVVRHGSRPSVGARSERRDRAMRRAAARRERRGARADAAACADVARTSQPGLCVAVVVIFLLLAANFQSLRLAFVVLSTVPAVLAGVVLIAAR